MRLNFLATFIFLLLFSFIHINPVSAIIDECNYPCLVDQGAGCGTCPQNYGMGCVTYSWVTESGEQVKGPWCDPTCYTNLSSSCTLRCSPCWNYAYCPAAAPTATPPPQPTNPPPGGGHCDSGCINQCGYRNGDGSCTTNNACCHRACSNNTCNTVAGGGSNACDNNSNCVSNNPPGCNTITMAYSPIPGHVGQSTNLQITSGDASTYIDDFYSGGVSSCNGSWSNKTCTANASGTYRWTHQWRHCVGDTDLAHCSILCQQYIDFTIADLPPPACDSNQLTMTINPNPVQNGQNLTFSLSGTQGSTNPYDSFTGGVNCANAGFWPNKTCTSTTPGTYTWTHYWQNCVGANCSAQCSKSANFTVTNPNTSFNGIVLDPNGNRWSPGSNCASRQGITASSSNGNLAWQSDVFGGHFDVTTAIVNQATVVSISAPESCHYTCDRWTTTDGSASGFGCNATFTAIQPDWNRNLIFYLKPNCTGSCIAPYCGQSDGCLGTCSSTDSVSPSPTTVVYPDSTVTNPVVYKSTDTINYSWVKSTDTLVDGYNLSIYNASNTLVSGPHTINGINTTTFSLPASTFSTNQVYHWQIRTFNNTCNGINGFSTVYSTWSSPGYFKIDNPPSITTFVIENTNSTVVNSENINGSQVNQICDPRFINSRTLKIGVTATDGDGSNDVDSIQLIIGSNSYTLSGANVVNGQATFTVSNLADSSTFYSIKAIATDKHGVTSPLTDSGRLLKMWDCLVNVHGTLYNGSKAPFGVISCNSGSNEFTDLIGETNWTSLKFQNATGDKNMAINAPQSKYESNANKLVYGKSYLYSFNVDLAAATPQMRIPNSSTCQNTLLVNSNIVDPYSNSPDLQVDFSTIKDQDPWFQVSAGGINAVKNISDSVPITCITPDCNPVISYENTSIGSANNSLIFGDSIDKGCDTCTFGTPNNWGYSSSRSNLSENYSYSYFYNNYDQKYQYVKFYNQDTTLSTIKLDTGGTGVVIIDGNVNLDIDNTLSDNQFLMIVAHKNITIVNTVNQLVGIFVADGSITASGKSTSDTQLIINGALYSAFSNVSLSRSFNTTSKNNDTPATIVNFLPSLIFNIPSLIPQMTKLYKSGI